jgi:hypothetical protein
MMLLTKFDAWRYENEVRLFIALKQEQKRGALYFAEFDEQIQPSTITLGPRCPIPPEEIDAAVSDRLQFDGRIPRSKSMAVMFWFQHCKFLEHWLLHQSEVCLHLFEMSQDLVSRSV